MSAPEERTLDALAGGMGYAGAARPRRAAVTPRADIGTGFLGTGAAVVVGIRAIYGFAWFVERWAQYPMPGLSLASWIVLIASSVAVFVAVRFVNDHLSHPVFGAYLAALAVAIGLDLWAVWPLGDIGGNATAAITAVMCLLIVLTVRRTSDLVVAAAAFGLVIAVAMVFTSPSDSGSIARQITALTGAVLPVVVGTVVVRVFRRMVQLELDRALVQSTVSAPRFAVGMLASEELASLDLAAEDLLESVASQRTPLPLPPDMASLAASLATELRLHLIEGRRETWLYHAISESELLGRSVTLHDKSGLAGLLDPEQRDGLLGAIWMLVADTTKPADTRSLTITLGPIAAPRSTAQQRIVVPVVIESTNVHRNRVDPSTWAALRRVGRYSDSTQNASLRVVIECLVENPADV